MQIKCCLNPKYEQALKDYNILQYDNDFVASHRTQIQDLQILSIVKDVSKEYQTIKDNYKVPEIDISKPIDVNVGVSQFIPGFVGGRTWPYGYIHFTVGTCYFKQALWQSTCKKQIKRFEIGSYLTLDGESIPVLDLFKEECKQELLHVTRTLLRTDIGPEEEQTFENIEKAAKKTRLQTIIDTIRGFAHERKN